MPHADPAGGRGLVNKLHSDTQNLIEDKDPGGSRRSVGEEDLLKGRPIDTEEQREEDRRRIGGERRSPEVPTPSLHRTGFSSQIRF